MEMRRELGYSLALHALVIVIGAVGLPFMASEPPEMTERIMVVDLSKVQIGEKTSLPKATTIDKPKGEELPEPPKAKPEPPKPEPPKPEPAKQEPPKPTPPKPEPPKPQVQEPPKPALVEPKKEPPKPEPKKAEEKKPEEKKTPQKPAEQKQPDKVPPKKAEPKPSFDDLLASVEKMRKDSTPPPATQTPANKAVGSKKGTPGALDVGAISKDNDSFNGTLTLSEMDAIRAQIERHWNVDPGKAGAQDMVIEIVVQYEPNGAVRSARIVDQARMLADPAFRSLAESALRAVFMANPIQAPEKKYDVWREVRLAFRPQDRL